MSIRTLFILLVVILASLLSALGAWQMADSQAKVNAVNWLQKSNQLAAISQQASVELAVERGLGAHFLENLKPLEQGVQLKLEHQQRVVDQRLQRLQEKLQELLEIAAHHPIEHYQQRLARQVATLKVRRQDIEAASLGAVPALSSKTWIHDLSAIIVEVHGLAGVGLLPLENNIYSYSAQPIVSDLLFTMAEFLGRERAQLVVVLSRRTALTATELQLLTEQHSVFQQARFRTQAVIEQMPIRQTLGQEWLQFEQELLAYLVLRDDILNSHVQGWPYNIAAEEWFTQASRTIQSIDQIQRSVEQQLDTNITQLRHNAEQSQQLVLFVFGILFVMIGLGVYLLIQRILRPLQALVQATHSITGGTLTQPLINKYNDEIGLLTQAFESMRQQLYTEQQRQQQQSVELKKLHTAIDQSVAAMLITDHQGHVEYVNHQFEKVTGYGRAELYGVKAGIWRSGETSASSYQDMWDTIRAGSVWMGELLNQRKNGELYWALVSISPVCDDHGAITHYIDIHLDISEHKRVAERLSYVSHYNQTTNLPNRQLLLHQLARRSESKRLADAGVALISISIGRLKYINDSLGWAVGDQVLREVGQRLKACSGLQDIVSHQEGGKFTVLLSAVKDSQIAVQRAEHMVNALTDILRVQDHQLQLIPKAGIALANNLQDDFEMLLKNSDLALHHAEKSADSVRLYDHDMDISTHQRLVMETALRQALKANGLELHYQPKMDLRSGAMVAVEALVRWRPQDTQHYISPAVFVPLAESNGLIHELGDWVLTEACQQAVRWQQQGLPFMVMAVNVSAEQLKHPAFPARVAEILANTGLAPQWLELELTESLFVENPDQALITLTHFKSLGLKLAIDDFGTGYSSLSYLSWLPVDTLKIDRSFIHNITTDLRAAAIATSIIALGHRMGLTVIAEGVETHAQLNYLAQHQCDEIQGFYISRPLTAEHLVAFLHLEKLPIFMPKTAP